MGREQLLAAESTILFKKNGSTLSKEFKKADKSPKNIRKSPLKG